jgi:hypothetical protein
MRHIRDVWEVDVGALNGVVPGSRLAVHRAEPLQEVAVVDVHTDRSIVEPIGWSPNAEQLYDMVLTHVPLPPVAALIQTSSDVAGRLAEAVRTAGPRRWPVAAHPHHGTGCEPSARLLLRVRQADDGRTVQVTSPTTSRWLPRSTPTATAVHELEHIARWLQVRNLSNPTSALEGAVRIEFLPAAAGGQRPPRDSEPLPAGNLVFTYVRSGTGWEPPSVFLRLRNTTDRRLFCVLLGLTDRHRIHADLLPGEYVAGRWTAEVGRGGPVTLALPLDRPVEPGASVTDWLLLVAEEPFNSDLFALPRLGEVSGRSHRGGRRGISGVLDRLGLLAVKRDAIPEPTVALDWAVEVVEITTRVPE